LLAVAYPALVDDLVFLVFLYAGGRSASVVQKKVDNHICIKARPGLPAR
jgi:hypothetical protein